VVALHSKGNREGRTVVIKGDALRPQAHLTANTRGENLEDLIMADLGGGVYGKSEQPLHLIQVCSPCASGRERGRQSAIPFLDRMGESPLFLAFHIIIPERIFSGKNDAWWIGTPIAGSNLRTVGKLG